MYIFPNTRTNSKEWMVIVFEYIVDSTVIVRVHCTVDVHVCKPKTHIPF